MHKELLDFAVRLGPLLREPSTPWLEADFNRLALELFRLQFQFNQAYRKICESRGLAPRDVGHWGDIPFVPTAAFKELELTSIPGEKRTAVFHSSGTTEQVPSRHFHCRESLAIYEESLWRWFDFSCGVRSAECEIVTLTPSPEQVPNSSLVHMFQTLHRHIGSQLRPPHRSFFGTVDRDGVWTIDFDAVIAALSDIPHSALRTPRLIVGTAFSFVHLLDFLVEKDLRFRLPPGSLVMETGGYKNRSRSMPKSELHAVISDRLGIPPENIVCEYGMSELSSQAYDVTRDAWRVTRNTGDSRHVPPVTRHFTFPPWARARIISPETGKEVAEGETGLIRILDLANVFSVAAVQTEDLGVKHGGGFELIGRAQMAEARGCSLMSA